MHGQGIAVEHHQMKWEKKTFIDKGYIRTWNIFTCKHTLLNAHIAIFADAWGAHMFTLLSC